MTEPNDERISKAALRHLRSEAPADLVAGLKRAARAKKSEPSVWDALREALSGNAWAYGAGAAFAAAGVLFAIVRAIPERDRGSDVRSIMVIHAAPAPSEAELAELWTDDDGGDHD